VSGPSRTPARGTPAVPASAATVGDYSLLAKIGEGGMGVVHLARRGEDGERVALKVLRPHIVGDDEARARLAREVSSLSRIRSRWVAEIVDADPWGPVPYVATRYVPGLSLHDHVHEEGPIEGTDLIWFAACLAEGVASVHAVDVLHRDVKPSNVLMEGRTPILIDFGLARVADDPKLTHTGWLLGTPGYLAPEILYGDDATTASDVHSWAATVAYAATGRPPFGRGPSMAIMDRVRRGEHDLSGIAEPLRSLLAEALHPEPHHRPTLAEIRETLAPAAGLRTAPATPPVPEPMTMPLAVAGATVLDERTDVLPVSGADGVTRRLTEEQTVVGRDCDAADPERDHDRDHDWDEAWPATEVTTGVPWQERLRRGTLLSAGALVCGAAVAAYPWFASLGLVLLTWVLRSGSLAASAAGQRRRLRGRKWYDGAQFLLRTPWDLVRSIPITAMLIVWSAGLALAAALLCYAFVAGERLTLAVCGATFAIAVWTGPGGSRVRMPLARVVNPLSRSWRPWAAAIVVTIVAAMAVGLLAEQRGTQWTPGDDRPLSGQLTGHGLQRVAP
jgi:Protein kinase domain